METMFKRNNNVLINNDNSALVDRKEKKIIMGEIATMKLRMEKLEAFLQDKGFSLNE